MGQLMLNILIIFIILLVLMMLKALQKQNNSNATEILTETELPYKSKYLLTKTEYSFYKILKPIIDKHNCLICPKVGLKDIMEITDKTNYMKWFGKISQKHIDFLICDSDLKPLFALELDDKSHEREKSKEKDNFKNCLFEVVNLPLKRVKTNNYDELENLLFPNRDI